MSWSSKRQAIVTLSMTEAESIAVPCTTQQALWMHNFLIEINIWQQLLVNLHINNQLLIALAEFTKGQSHVKHIDIKYHYIYKHLHEDNITLTHILSKDNLTNLFIKLLAHIAYEHLIRLLGLQA